MHCQAHHFNIKRSRYNKQVCFQGISHQKKDAQESFSAKEAPAVRLHLVGPCSCPLRLSVDLDFAPLGVFYGPVYTDDSVLSITKWMKGRVLHGMLRTACHYSEVSAPLRIAVPSEQPHASRRDRTLSRMPARPERSYPILTRRCTQGHVKNGTLAGGVRR